MEESNNNLPRFANQFVSIYMYEMASRVVASTGRPSDLYHLGKLVLQSLKDAPDLVSQIDGALNQSETNGSVLARSVRCAEGLRSLGLGCGDVMMLMAPNHLDVTIAVYGAIFSGVVVAPVDANMKGQELQLSLTTNKPKIIFCESAKVPEIKEALKKTNMDAYIITFDHGEPGNATFKELLDNNNVSVEDFIVADLDPAESLVFLTSTSGTTGLPKSIALTHKNVFMNIPQFFSRFYDFPIPETMVLVISPLQWITAMMHNIMAPILRYKRLQTSAYMDVEHIFDLINKFKPTMTIMSPNFVATLMKQNKPGRCDFTCFKDFLIGGAHVYPSTLEALKKVAPNADVHIMYGMSECAGLTTAYDIFVPPGSVGRPLGNVRHRLVDVNTLKDINEPNVTGELWIKGPSVFKGYYNHPESTKATITEEGWLRTGDLMRRDENHFYYYVDRLKIMLKYKGDKISPLEVETVIRKLQDVDDVAVVGVPDEECGDLLVACVVRTPGTNVTAREVKDIVNENLAECKQLRGGVVFMDKLPLGLTTKCDRFKLKEMVLLMDRE